jgi:hypothetical protein
VIGASSIWAARKSLPYLEVARHLLIGTRIIRAAYRRKHTGYEYALALQNLSLFWNPPHQEKMTILIKPDVRSIRTLARLSNFAFECISY